MVSYYVVGRMGRGGDSVVAAVDGWGADHVAELLLGVCRRQLREHLREEVDVRPEDARGRQWAVRLLAHLLDRVERVCQV